MTYAYLLDEFGEEVAESSIRPWKTKQASR